MYEDDYTKEYVAEENIHIEKITSDKSIYGTEVFIQDNIDAEEYQLCIYNNKIDIEININFCPICGSEL